jgi:hypothetical protein
LGKKHASRQHFALRYWRVIVVLCGRERLVISGDNLFRVISCSLIRRPVAQDMAVVENWRQLPDGRIEFTMRYLPTAD